jgi:hypothetical protein
MADVSELQEEVIRAWESTVTMEATRATVEHAMATSAQEAAAMQERVTTFIEEAEAQVILAEREA